jgi:hypothetical protein
VVEAQVIQNPHMLPKVRSAALMSGVEGMPCSLRIASFNGQSCAGNDTVVACHLPVFGKGIASKVSDMFTVAGCRVCHEILDGTVGVELRHRYPAAFTERLLLALCETQARHVMTGRIVVPDAELV